MSRQIFVNLPVADLPRAVRFYEAMGFAKQEHYSDEAGAGMALNDAIFVMLLTHARWRTFTDRPIPPATVSEVLLALSFDSRDAVGAVAEAAARAGGTVDVNPPQDHGFMMSRAIADPDGHVWEAFWMDPDVASGAKQPEEP